MRTFAIVNRKGGVGKTATAVNLAYILATSYKKRVLLIDADSQANASSIVTKPNEAGLAAVLQGNEPHYENLIDQTDISNLDLLPATEELADLDLQCMAGLKQPAFFALRNFLEVLAEDDVYDILVIDCPPYFSLSCVNAIMAADRIIIPTDTDGFSTGGMGKLVKQIDSIRKACPDVVISGCLVTRWKKSDVAEDAINYLRDKSPIHIFQHVIRASDDKVRESTWAGQAVAQWSPWSNASRDYRAWVAELLEQEAISHDGV